jgi:3-oxoacyl-[acyl-carrier-protein] synthase II
MTRNRVVVTGLGVQTPLGADPVTFWSRLLSGETAGKPWPDLAAEGFPIHWACRIPDTLGELDPTRRGRALALAAARQAVADAELRADRVGVFVGTTMGESAAFEAAAEGAELRIDESCAGAFASEIADKLGFDGPRRTYGTACAAGNYAVGAAAAAIRSGRVDAALAGGAEPFSRIALLGFARMRAMSPGLCRPFDVARCGMSLGEAAAFLVLEREEVARRRRAEPLAVVGGLGLSGDAFHPTAPREDGSGMAAAMRACLDDAGVAAADVGWVCAHGTGTSRSDAAEGRALHHVFGERPPPVSSIKGALGHSLGAATAVEAAVAVLAVREGVLPPNTNLLETDATLELDVVAEPRPAPDLGWAMSCGYGFGGLNSAILIGAL